MMTRAEFRREACWIDLDAMTRAYPHLHMMTARAASCDLAMRDLARVVCAGTARVPVEQVVRLTKLAGGWR